MASAQKRLVVRLTKLFTSLRLEPLEELLPPNDLTHLAPALPWYESGRFMHPDPRAAGLDISSSPDALMLLATSQDDEAGLQLPASDQDDAAVSVSATTADDGTPSGIPPASSARLNSNNPLDAGWETTIGNENSGQIIPGLHALSSMPDSLFSSQSDPSDSQVLPGPASGTYAGPATAPLEGLGVSTPAVLNVGAGYPNQAVRYHLDQSGYPATGFPVPRKHPPILHDVTYGVHANMPLVTDSTAGVLANANDRGAGYQLVVNDVLDGPHHGQLDINGDGSFTYTPDRGFEGTDSFQYDAANQYFVSNAATVTFSVHSTNTPPVATDGQYSVGHRNPLTVTADQGLVALAADADHDPLAAQVVRMPGHGRLDWGTDGAFTYTPQGTYVGVDSFTYRVYDGVDYSASATVSLTLTNTAPIIADTSFKILHDNQLLDGVTPAAYDSDGDPLTISKVDGPSHGEVVVSPGGGFTYTPDLHYTGPDSFTYKATDGWDDSTVATATILVYDTPPWTNESVFAVTRSDKDIDSISLQNMGGDDDGDRVSVKWISDPKHGYLKPVGGGYTYNPYNGYHGPDSFDYQLTDGTLDSDVRTVPVIVGDGITPAAFDGGAEMQANILDTDNYILSEPAATGALFSCIQLDARPIDGRLGRPPVQRIAAFL